MRKLIVQQMRAFALGNNEPRFREILSPRGMSNSEIISTVRVSCDHPLTQTVLVYSLLGISQGAIISWNLAEGSLLRSSTMSPSALIVEQ